MLGDAFGPALSADCSLALHHAIEKAGHKLCCLEGSMSNLVSGSIGGKPTSTGDTCVCATRVEVFKACDAGRRKSAEPDENARPAWPCTLLIERFEWWIKGAQGRAGLQTTEKFPRSRMNGERSSWTVVANWGNGCAGRPESTQNAKSFPGAGTISTRQEEKPANPKMQSGPG